VNLSNLSNGKASFLIDNEFVMASSETICETIEYRSILVCPSSRKVLARAGVGGYHLPQVRIPLCGRPVVQLRKALKECWGLTVFVVDLLPAQTEVPRCVVAEVFLPDLPSELTPVAFEAIASRELSEDQRSRLASLFSEPSPLSASSLGWIDEAILWLESETARRLSSKERIEQVNAGGSFSLIRFPMDDGTEYWLKATGEPNVHELSITTLLSSLSENSLPSIVSVRASWNAWLMSGVSQPVDEVSTDPECARRTLGEAGASMAELQMNTQGCTQALIDAGAFDQSLNIFQEHSEAIFEFLEEAMARQTTTKVVRLERTRLQEIRKIFEVACGRLSRLDLPLTIVHGDMSCGNILTSYGRCQFIDWAEAYVSNPLISLQHLLLLNRIADSEHRNFVNQGIKEQYRRIWLESCSADAFDQGLAMMPILAVASTLYGRGDWLTSNRRDNPSWQTYARCLARHMDRSASQPELMEALCH
jgi:thiamine kinase-like enzyme